jgi:hypothetical protein
MLAELPPYRLYIREQILAGKSHQDVFNDVVDRYDIAIHQAAETIRKMPTLANRKRYQNLNLILILLSALACFAQPFVNGMQLTYTFFMPNVGFLLLAYGLFYFKSSAHFIATLFLSLLGVFSLTSFIVTAHVGNLLVSLVFFIAASIAGYLNKKLVSDYRLNRDKINTDSLDRKNSILFLPESEQATALSE